MIATIAKPKRHKAPSAKWRKLLRLIPGYDPFAQAEGCWFDEKAAQKALDFFPEMLHHVEGALAGTPFIVEPWQQSVIANLFGWKMIDRHGREVRRYRECLIYVPRKNGKTPLIAGVACYVFFCDQEAGQQDYIAAGEREQAGMLFRQVKGMVNQEPELKDRCRIYGGTAAAGQSKSLVREEDGSFLRVVAAEGDTLHGGTTHLAVIDEVHVQKNRNLFDTFATSFASQNRASPLFIGITTADFNRESICNEWHDRACKVRDNGGDRMKPGYDPAFLPVIFETGIDDDWTDPAVWQKANPNLGVSVSLDYLERECQKAKENPAYQNTFRRLHLNQKTQQDQRAIDMEVWAAGGLVKYTDESLLGRECFGGLDLASVSDITALVLLFPPRDEREQWKTICRFWVPEHAAEERDRKDRVPYLSWVRTGLMTAHPGDDGEVGNRLNYDFIRKDINDLAKQYQIRSLGVDPWNATQLTLQLQEDGLPVVLFQQGMKSMTAPTKELLAMLAGKQLAHNGNPVLNWMAGNLATEEDAAGNLKPSKAKSTEKIDGMVALIMARGVSMTEPEQYEFRPGDLAL
jgi:phage terminase large subunit-like protein